MKQQIQAIPNRQPTACLLALNEDEAEVKDEGRAKDEVKAEDEDEETGAADQGEETGAVDQDEETGAADGAATAMGRRSRRMRGYATTVPKRGTSNSTVQFENEPPRLATKTP